MCIYHETIFTKTIFSNIFNNHIWKIFNYTKSYENTLRYSTHDNPTISTTLINHYSGNLGAHCQIHAPPLKRASIRETTKTISPPRWTGILPRTYIVEITTFSGINNVVARHVATCVACARRGEMREEEMRGRGGGERGEERKKSSRLKFLEINELALSEEDITREKTVGCWTS